MLGALIIVFREVVEAGLIVGIVMAVIKGIRGTRRALANRVGCFRNSVGYEFVRACVAHVARLRRPALRAASGRLRGTLVTIFTLSNAMAPHASALRAGKPAAAR